MLPAPEVRTSPQGGPMTLQILTTSGTAMRFPPWSTRTSSSGILGSGHHTAFPGPLRLKTGGPRTLHGGSLVAAPFDPTPPPRRDRDA